MVFKISSRAVLSMVSNALRHINACDLNFDIFSIDFRGKSLCTHTTSDVLRSGEIRFALVVGNFQSAALFCKELTIIPFEWCLAI